MTPRIILAAVAILALASAGCATKSRLSFASSKLFDLQKADLKRLTPVRQVDGSDSAGTILGLMPLGIGPSVNRAIDDALSKGGGDFMTDVDVTTTVWPLLLVTWTHVSVEGNVYAVQGR